MIGQGGLAWVLSLVTLAVVARVLMLPFVALHYGNRRRAQEFEERLQALEAEYGDEPERFGQERKRLMESGYINPLAMGCQLVLKSVLQFLLFFGLFQILYSAGGLGFAKRPELAASLAGADLWGVRLVSCFWLGDWSAFGVTQYVALALVILIVGRFYLSQWHVMSRNPPPPGKMRDSMKVLIHVAPLAYLITGAWLPVGLLVYSLTSGLWLQAQQWWGIIRTHPNPGTPAFRDWEKRMARKGRSPGGGSAEMTVDLI